MFSTPLEQTALRVVQLLQDAGFTAFWAGGCVRDRLLGLHPKDVDIATDATPDQVLDIFPDAVAVGKAFGVVRARVQQAEFEIATFRRDDVYLDGRRPSGVTFTTPRVDAARRDFTINALFFDPVACRLHDFVGGQKDLQDGLVRCVGNPTDRFREDHLRMLRAVRFASVLGFDLHPATRRAVREQAESLRRVSAERIRDEFTRLLLEGRRPGDTLGLLLDLRLLQVFLPEVAALKGVEQPVAFHPEGDVFAHTALMLNLMEHRTVELAYAVLLHDVGKPATARITPERTRFDHHAEHGSRLASDILRRLRFPSVVVKSVSSVIGRHMRFMHVQEMREATLRRLIGSPLFSTELELHRLDCLASHGKLDNYHFLEKARQRISSEPVLPRPWVNGHDLMDMGMKEGPELGAWRGKAYEAQLDGTFKNKQELVAWLRSRITTPE